MVSVGVGVGRARKHHDVAEKDGKGTKCSTRRPRARKVIKRFCLHPMFRQLSFHFAFASNSFEAQRVATAAYKIHETKNNYCLWGSCFIDFVGCASDPSDPLMVYHSSLSPKTDDVNRRPLCSEPSHLSQPFGCRGTPWFGRSETFWTRDGSDTMKMMVVIACMEMFVWISTGSEMTS